MTRRELIAKLREMIETLDGGEWNEYYTVQVDEALLGLSVAATDMLETEHEQG